MSLLMLLNLLLIVFGPFLFAAPMFAVAQRAGAPASKVRRPRRRLSLPVPSGVVFA